MYISASGVAIGAAPEERDAQSEQAENFLRLLYERHGSVLLRFAVRLLDGDWHRAEDIVQEAAIRAWRHAGTVEPEDGAARPWLFTVVRRLVIDGHRAQAARPPESGEADPASMVAPDIVDRTLTAQVVTEAMADLAPYQREVLLHLYYLGHTVRQTARAIGVPSGTVKSRTYYAMRALRGALAARGVTTP
ncbi:sigma-70 family RNA polymerase sigma factor [Streptomyces sp. NA02950]|uniref:sigma-70 family RNA polymerase sigma factor n=1 Tax=Streptomyces sp. NA02950 TaxID=2742137 RepID=UPI0015920746|nr:sigma-70 family RNA polymerase sigma factor [Streptomyces sp. NA02950]QKV91143.1 sigma-70 family RNA polymerase sigma factor [Streptomyces sp. NA02950]